MIVKLSSDCRIDASDGLSFTLQVRKPITEKTVGGKVSKRAGQMGNWENKGYYGNMLGAMNGVIKYSLLHGSEEKELKEAIVVMAMLVRRVESACEGMVSATSAATFSGVVEAEDLDSLFK